MTYAISYAETEALDTALPIFLVPSNIANLHRDNHAVVANMRFIAKQTGAVVIGSPNDRNTFFPSSNGVENYETPRYVQDHIHQIPESNTVFLDSEYSDLARIVPIDSNIIKNKTLAEGGKYSMGHGLSFVAGIDSDSDTMILAEAFENSELIKVPTPSELGISISPYRVNTHIDQFIGGPIIHTDGSYVVPIHEEYYELALPSLPIEANEKEIRFCPLGEPYIMNYIFNYPLITDNFFVDPLLLKGLEEIHGISKTDLDDVIELPHGMRLLQDGAGLKCRTSSLI